jgi:uncharacterized RDD family membrane protein YckC
MNDFNPYGTPSALLLDPVDPGGLELAERGTRLAAKFLDALLGVGGIGILSALLIPALLAQRKLAGTGHANPVPLAVFGFLMLAGALALVALNLVWLHTRGQTVAKRMLGIRIVREDGTRAGLGRILGLRVLAVTAIEFIPLVGPLFFLTDACFIFREDRRCLHDLMAGTQVVKA